MLAGEVEGTAIKGSNIKFYIEIVKLPIFNIETSRVGRFTTTYKLYLKRSMRRATVEK